MDLEENETKSEEFNKGGVILLPIILLAIALFLGTVLGDETTGVILLSLAAIPVAYMVAYEKRVEYTKIYRIYHSIFLFIMLTPLYQMIT